MKINICFLIMIFLTCSIFSQEKIEKDGEKKEISAPEIIVKKVKRKRNQNRLPDSHWPNFVSVQTGYGHSVHESDGINVSLVYERKLQAYPISLFMNYTFSNYKDQNLDTSYDEFENSIIKKDFQVKSNHIGGGFHYFPLNYALCFKPYVGASVFFGSNTNSIKIEEDNIFIEKSYNGLDYGFFGIIGARWHFWALPMGFEYRVGYINSEILGSRESGAIHEFVFVMGVRF